MGSKAPLDAGPYQLRWRERIGVALANAALRLTTPEYRGFVMRALEGEIKRRRLR